MKKKKGTIRTRGKEEGKCTERREERGSGETKGRREFRARR